MNLRTQRNATRCLLAAALVAAHLSPAGCGGQRRYPLEGTVTFQGQPVPYGEVMFAPNAAAGNTGPGTVATIHGGRYQTPSELGIVGGKYVIEVSGFNKAGEDGIPLFAPWKVEVQLPESGGKFDIEVPATQSPARSQRPGR